MSDWCRNHFEITGKSPLLAVAEEWIKGETEPLYRHAVMQSIKIFLAGYSGLLRPVKTASFSPFPELIKLGVGQNTLANQAYEQWLEYLKKDVPLDGHHIRLINRVYHQSGIGAIKWESIPELSRRHIGRLMEDRYADWFGVASLSRDIDFALCWEKLGQFPERSQPCDLLQIIPSRLAAEINGSGGLLAGMSTATSLYCRLYGMEWPAGHNVRFQREGINSIKLSFDSPWFPPSGESVAALSAMFDCEVRHWYSEPAHELEGFDCYDRGQLVSSGEVTIDELAAEVETVVPDNVDEPESVDSAQSSLAASYQEVRV